jgi:hypothetical protein
MSLAYAAPFDDSLSDTEDAYGFAALARGEQLIVWSLRAIALGHAECPALRRTFEVALGSSAEEAFAALFLAVRTLGWGATRKLRLHTPGCACVSADEREVVALLALAQEGVDEASLRRRVAALVSPPLHETFIDNLQAVASALEVHGYPLPLRGAPTRPRVVH